MRCLAFFFLLGAAACSAPDTRQATTATTTAPPDSVTAPLAPPDTKHAGQVTAQSDTLQVVRRQHLFSAPATPDLFLLTMRGKDLLTGEATFTITDASGQVIFREILTPADLEAALVYELDGRSATPAQREAYVRRRMDEFFADKNFHQPAVPAGSSAPADNANRAAWNELRQHPSAVSFDYLVGKEDRRRIAWSSQQKQVVHLGGVGS